MLVKRLVINDAGEEVEEEYDDGQPDPSTEDRGDELNLDDDDLEVDEDIVAALANGDDGKETGMIPKARFNEVNEEKKTLKEENEALKAQIAAGVAAPAAAAAAKVDDPPAFDVDAQELAYADAIIEGDVEKAKSIRKAIKEFETAELKKELRVENTVATETEKVEARKQDVITTAFAAHPELDHSSDTYDKALVAKINRMNTAYLAEGKPADEALKLAIADFVKPVEAKADDVIVDKGDAAAKKKNAAASGAQPAGLGGVGVGARAAAATPDIATLTDAEYDALPEREKKRLRGD